MKIFDVRGTNGAGKSWVVHNILNNQGYDPYTLADEHDPREKTIGYEIEELNLQIVGPYTSICGGCDRIAKQDDIERYVREAASEANVLFEGLLVSHTFGRWQQVHQDFKDAGHEVFLLFLDTPMERCIENVRSRREAQGNFKPYDPKNLVKDWHQARRVFTKFEEDNFAPRWVSSNEALTFILKELSE